MIKIQIFHAFFSKLSKKEKKLFYAAVIFISLALFDFLIISPVFSRMNSLDKEISDKISGIKKYSHILSQKDRIAAERDKYNSFLTSIKSEDEEITFLLKEIENMADKNSVYLVDMKPVESRGEGQQNKYLVSLNCESQMEQLVSFMYSIENSARLLTIDKYEISPKSKESSIVKCSMTISKIVKL